jgi:hypothetical protein
MIIIYRNYNNEIFYIKSNKISNVNNNNNNSIIISDTPSLRGYINYESKLIDEKGGSKPFNNININNDNLTINQVNYYKYESYRKKPLIIKNQKLE